MWLTASPFATMVKRRSKIEKLVEVILYRPPWNTISASALKPGRVIRVTFSPGHPGLTRFTIYLGLTRFTIYPGLTRIGSREKRNCSFDDVELINAIA